MSCINKKRKEKDRSDSFVDENEKRYRAIMQVKKKNDQMLI